jgi:hypothetical protein
MRDNQRQDRADECAHEGQRDLAPNRAAKHNAGDPAADEAGKSHAENTRRNRTTSTLHGHLLVSLPVVETSGPTFKYRILGLKYSSSERNGSWVQYTPNRD